MEQRATYGFVVIILLAFGAVSAPCAVSDSAVRVLRLSNQELLVVTTASSLRWREDFTTSTPSLRIELEGIRPTDNIRELTFPTGSTFSAFYARTKPTGCLLLIERTGNVGHVIAPLPYSRLLYIRAVNWNDSGEQLLAYGIDAWSRQRYDRAESFWRSALARGQQQASVWLGIAKALEGRNREARDYLESVIASNNIIPDAFAAVAAVYQAEADYQRAAVFRERFINIIGTKPGEPPRIKYDTVANTLLLSPLEIFVAHQQNTTSQNTSDSVHPVPRSVDTIGSDLFAELRLLQGRSDSSTAHHYDSSENWNVSLLLLAGGGTLLLIRLVPLRGYLRWRRFRIEQLSLAMAQNSPVKQPSIPVTQSEENAQNPTEELPVPSFDELLKLIEEPNPKQAKATGNSESSSSTPTSEPTERAQLFDFDEETYREIEQRKTVQQIDEQLLFPSHAKPQPSPSDPISTSRELTDQERDLLALLERISKDYAEPEKKPIEKSTLRNYLCQSGKRLLYPDRL